MKTPFLTEQIAGIPAEHPDDQHFSNEWVRFEGEDYVAIRDLEDFDPFFLSIVTVTNQWFFCSSHGALSAGRESPETSLFPYLTVDKIHGNWNVTGPQTAIRCGETLWHPFWPTSVHGQPIQRRLLKSILGDELVFEEFHRSLKIRFLYRWQISGRFGFVRKVRVVNEGNEDLSLRLIDGLDDLQAPGVGSSLHLELSCLADAYRMSELVEEGRMLVHRLASGIVDAPIPMESLKATTIWCDGLENEPRFLSRREADAYLSGRSDRSSKAVQRGERGAFYLGADLTLPAGGSREWMMVGEVNQDHHDVAVLKQSLRDPKSLLADLEADLENGRQRLRSLVASVDGFQQSGDRDVTLYHYHNTVCNFLRGGLPESGGSIDRETLVDFVKKNNREVYLSSRDWFDELPERLDRVELLKIADQTGDLDVHRLCLEYLPLILGRRHGDPSRPWNKFKIRLEDEAGQPIHHYEGNWRDIFQNWEALAWSYPVFLDAFISRFLSASTIDGFNPYRVTSGGVDWEVPDPDDPWVSIGYWGDHQIIYLLKFLELKERLDPAGLRNDLQTRRFVFSDVPYRLKGWDGILADPRDTVVFDEEKHDRLMELKGKIGGDGLLLRDEKGGVVRANLLEKLLIPAIAKLGQLVPDGGVWMCNQKPEWNDANNALAGNGLSVVTAAYLLRYMGFLGDLSGTLEERELEMTAALVEVVRELATILNDSRWANTPLEARNRFAFSESVARAIERYRSFSVTAEGRGTTTMAIGVLRDLIGGATTTLEKLLRGNRRHDGLWHSYNIVSYQVADKTMEVRNLDLMLEGQVAILSSGLLSSEEAVDILEKLAASDLKSKRHPTYLLYPDRELPSFDELNRIPEEEIRKLEELSGMVDGGDDRLLSRDAEGRWRFDSSLVNGYTLAGRLSEISELSSEARAEIEQLYERVFHHQSFTGRSGSMFGYEGLGCVYWHMVSKLMLAAQEVVLGIPGSDDQSSLRERAIACYYDIQNGLGFRQKPSRYGAFPAEPYSHSQGERGAQQPGLTGQVKEGILCRLGELGVTIDNGCLAFRPRLLRQIEFANGDLTFTQSRRMVVYRVVDDLDDFEAQVIFENGETAGFAGAVLDSLTTRKVLYEDGLIERIEVLIPGRHLIA